MRYRPLGSSGLMVSTVGLGCNNVGKSLDADASRAVIQTALDEGITLFDTADGYGANRDGGSERILGLALRGSRDDVVLATKFGSDMAGNNGPDWGARGSRRYVHRAAEASLRRLQTDYIDLYQYHRPDGITPVEETLAALHELVTAGKVRYIGCSNFAGWQVADAHWTARTAGVTPFISVQNNYNLLEREVERDIVPACQAYGLGLLPYFPLASGLLTGKYERGQPPPPGSRVQRWGISYDQDAYDTVDRLSAYAIERGRSLLDVAIGGLAAQPTVASVIAGATSPEQVRSNVAAGAWQPSATDLAELDQVAPSQAAGR